MTTTERELTEPVDLCTPDGGLLNPATDHTDFHGSDLRTNP